MRKRQVRQRKELGVEVDNFLTRNMNDEEEDTFCYKLIEEGIFDVTKLKQIIKYVSIKRNIDKEALKWIIDCIDRCYIYHKDVSDLYYITNYSVDDENMWKNVWKGKLLQVLKQ